jgi:sulfur carrier protein ThiS
MTVAILYRDQVLEVRSGMTVRAALLKLEISPQSVLATRNGELITDDEIIRKDDQIRLIPVISGGCGR